MKAQKKLDAETRFLCLLVTEVCEGYVFTGVCLSTGGMGCAWLLAGGGVCMVAGRRACMVASWGVCVVVRGCVCGCGGVRACQGACVLARGGVHRIRRDTVNERAVRILLECILVIYITKLPILEQINLLYLPVTMGANPAVFARFLAKHLVRQEIVRTCGVAVLFFTTS